jgi:SAM-dependent methyltransferase
MLAALATAQGCDLAPDCAELAPTGPNPVDSGLEDAQMPHISMSAPPRQRGLGRLVRAAWRLATDRHYRRTKWLAWFGGRQVFQPFATTCEDRYPRIFACARERLGDGPGLSLLSVGCSTGEELVTLRRYFPGAAITGIDINPAAIAIACRKVAGLPGPAIRLETRSCVASEVDEGYDAIFCMAVFRDGRLGHSRPARCDRYLDFADFDAMAAALARVLKPGGLLAIRHSNFRFCDTSSAWNFDVVLDLTLTSETPLYGPGNRRLDQGPYGECVFVKSEGALPQR